MKTIKQIFVASILIALVSSCQSYMTSSNTLMKVQKGMTQKEIKNLLGEPKYRRFNEMSEEWEYWKMNPLNAETTIITVNFIDNHVSNMNSFSGDNFVNPPMAICPPNEVKIISPSIQPPYNINHRPYGKSMSNEDFQALFTKIKKKPFKDDQLKLLNLGATNNYFTCKQCRELMSIYTFDDDRLKVLYILAPRIADKQNYEEITDFLTFSSNKDKVKNLMGIGHFNN